MVIQEWGEGLRIASALVVVSRDVGKRGFRLLGRETGLRG